MQSIILPIMLAAVGWLFTSAIEDFSDRKILTYRIVNTAVQEQKSTIEFRNISPVRENISFVANLTCLDQDRNCFQKHDTATTLFYNHRLYHPHFVDVTTNSASESLITLNITMPPDSKLIIYDILLYNNENIIIFLESNTSDALVYLEGGTILAYLIENRIIIYVLLSVLLLFLLTLLNIIGLFTKNYRTQSQKWRAT